MKHTKIVRIIFIVAIVGLASLGLVVVSLIFRNNSQQAADQTSNVRASNLTYKRELDVIAGVSPTASPSATVFPLITGIATQSATLSATVTITATPTVYITPTEYFVATESATPTAITTLPKTGWTQNVSIMFIAASVLMFLSFLF